MEIKQKNHKMAPKVWDICADTACSAFSGESQDGMRRGKGEPRVYDKGEGGQLLPGAYPNVTFSSGALSFESDTKQGLKRKSKGNEAIPGVKKKATYVLESENAV